MTYADDIASAWAEVGWYVELAGFSTFLSTHDFSALFGTTGTFHECLSEKDRPEIGKRTLNEHKHFVTPGDFTVRVLNDATALGLIRRRGGTETRLLIACDASTTTIQLESTALATTVVHVDQEAILLGSHTGGGTYTGCTRGYKSTAARSHVAEQIASTVPRHLMERIGKLHVVNLATGTSRVLAIGVLSDSVPFEDGAWHLTFTSLETILNRPLLQGWQAVTVPPSEMSYVFSIPSFNIGFSVPQPSIVFTVPDVRQFAMGDAAYEPGHVKLTVGGKSAICLIDNVDDVGSTVRVFYPGHRLMGDLNLPPEEIARGDHGDVTIQQVHVLSTRPGVQALQVMVSDLGDGTQNDPYDALPGRAPSVTSSSADFAYHRVGAGIPASLVDITAFQNIDGAPMRTVLDEPISVMDFLVSEVLWRLNAYLYITEAGLISIKRYKPLGIRSEALASDAPDDQLESQVFSVDNESQTIGSVDIECNYLPGGEFKGRFRLAWDDLTDVYGTARPSLKLRTKSLWIGAAPPNAIVSAPMDSVQLLGVFDRMRSITARAGVRRKKRLPWSKHVDFQIGERFVDDDPDAPDHEGAVGSAMTMEVVGLETSLQSGEHLIEARGVPRGWVIGSSAFVASWNAGTLTLTLTTSGSYLFDNTFPGQYFPDDCFVRLWDRSGNFAVSERAQVASIGISTIVLTALPAMTPAVGDLVVIDIGVDTGNENILGADVEDFAFGSDASYEVGSTRSPTAGPTWG